MLCSFVFDGLLLAPINLSLNSNSLTELRKTIGCLGRKPLHDKHKKDEQCGLHIAHLLFLSPRYLGFPIYISGSLYGIVSINSLKPSISVSRFSISSF